MTGYRLCCLDGSGRSTTIHEIDAHSDAEALKAAREMKLAGKWELWEHGRKLATLDACHA